MGRIVSKRGRPVAEPEAQPPEAIDDWIEQMSAQTEDVIDDLEEIIRKTTQGVPDITYIDFGDEDEWTRI